MKALEVCEARVWRRVGVYVEVCGFSLDARGPARPHCAGSSRSRGKLTVFTVLCEQYQPSLRRDPMYNEVRAGEG